MTKNKPVALMTVSAVVTQQDTDAIKKMADQGFDVVVVQDKDFEGAVKIMRKLSKQQATVIPVRPVQRKDQPKIKQAKTVNPRACKTCGGKDIELYDCGYSSYNMGGGKCRGCGSKASGPVSTFPDKIELVSIWNTAQMPTREEKLEKENKRLRLLLKAKPYSDHYARGPLPVPEQEPEGTHGGIPK